MSGPELIGHLREALLAQHPRRHTFQRVHEAGKLDRRRIVDEQMDVVVLTITLAQNRAEALGSGAASFPTEWTPLPAVSAPHEWGGLGFRDTG